ncbi:MAG: DUF4097 family beta strand repeat-containing protein [Tissierellia bacterium]|nr:DUF4097 family beta strand repeat-containing protein [Tissierellia bacterium]
MSDEKRMILNMLKEGKITEDEAIKLLDAVGERETEKMNFSEMGSDLAKKIMNSVEKVLKKTGETISNIDFEEIGQSFQSGTKYSARIEKTATVNLEGTEKPNIKLKNINGRIHVFQWDNDYIELRSKISFDDKLLRDDYEFIKAEKVGDKITIRSNLVDNRRQPFIAHMSIAFPRRPYKDFEVSTVNGAIEINFIEADELEASSVNGRITLNSVRAKEQKYKSTNGTIAINEAEGKEIDAKTVNGKISAHGIYVGEFDAKVTNGSIYIGDISEATKDISLKTTNGSIDVDITDFTRPIKVELKRNSKHSSKINLSPRFTSILTEDRYINAFTEGYSDAHENRLHIEGVTANGSIAID